MSYIEAFNLKFHFLFRVCRKVRWSGENATASCSEKNIESVFLLLYARRDSVLLSCLLPPSPKEHFHRSRPTSLRPYDDFIRRKVRTGYEANKRASLLFLTARLPNERTNVHKAVGGYSIFQKAFSGLGAFSLSSHAALCGRADERSDMCSTYELFRAKS